MPRNDAISTRQTPGVRRPGWVGYAVTVVLGIVVTAGLAALEPRFPLAHYPVAYVVVLMAVAYYYGEGPAVLAFVVGLVAYDYFLMSPAHRLWPMPATRESWARAVAFSTGAAIGGLMMVVLRRSRRRIEAIAGKLRDSEYRYAVAQRAANIGSWDWDIQTGGLRWSEQIEPMFGFENGRFGGTYEAFLDCVHPEDRQFVIDSLNAAVYEGKDYAIEHRIVCPNGTIRWVSETGEVHWDESGLPVRMLGIVQDVTELVKLRRSLEHQLTLLQRALTQLPQFHGRLSSKRPFTGRIGHQNR